MHKRGRPQGSDTDARDRLLEAAGKLFAERGYAGVSTREVARSARVNLSASTITLAASVSFTGR